MLGRLEMDIETCIAAYIKLSSAVFKVPWYWRVVYLVSGTMHLLHKRLLPYFDSGKLEAVIQEIIKEQGIRRHETLRDLRDECCRV